MRDVHVDPSSGPSPGGPDPAPSKGRRTDDCDGYVVLLADPTTGELDTFGPYPWVTAASEAHRRRIDLDAGGLPDVQVEIVRFHRV